MTMADATYQPKVYMTAGGDKQVVASGGELDVESGGALKIAGTQVTASAAELNAESAKVASFTMTAAAGAANITEVTATAKDAAGATLAGVHNFDLWLSDATTGAGLTGTSASGTVTAKSASGEVVGTFSAKKALRAQTLASGVFILEITDTAKTAFKVCAQVPGTGKTVVGITLATGDYG